MNVPRKRDWLRTCASGERLGRTRTKVEWSVFSRYGWLLMLGFLTVSFYIWQNVQIISDGYEIERLKRHLAELQSQNSLLAVEVGTLEDLGGMEQRASMELGMVRPAPGQIVFVRGSGNGGRGEPAHPDPAAGN